jgi:hypothetical protein
MSIEERSDAAFCWTRQYREAFAAIGGDAVAEIMRAYLEDEDFGFDAGLVLKETWERQQNTPAPSPFSAWPDFATVSARRQERRVEATQNAAVPPAAMIFAAIERLVTPGRGEPHQRIAVALGRIGISMPHGNQGAAIEALLALPQPLRNKREFLTALVLDGEAISAGLPLQAVREWLAAAREKTWMYHESLLEVEGWLQLLPFSDRPAATIEGVELVIAALPQPRALEHVVSALGDAPGEEAERALRELMERHPEIASRHDWAPASLSAEHDRRPSCSWTLPPARARAPGRAPEMPIGWRVNSSH